MASPMSNENGNASEDCLLIVRMKFVMMLMIIVKLIVAITMITTIIK